MCGTHPCNKTDCTWSERHRRASEARTVMQWPREERTEYYADVKKRRGDAAAQQLIEDVKEQWTLSQRQPSLL